VLAVLPEAPKAPTPTGTMPSIYHVLQKIVGSLPSNPDSDDVVAAVKKVLTGEGITCRHPLNIKIPTKGKRSKNVLEVKGYDIKISVPKDLDELVVYGVRPSDFKKFETVSIILILWGVATIRARETHRETFLVAHQLFGFMFDQHNLLEPREPIGDGTMVLGLHRLIYLDMKDRGLADVGKHIMFSLGDKREDVEGVIITSFGPTMELLVRCMDGTEAKVPVASVVHPLREEIRGSMPLSTGRYRPSYGDRVKIPGDRLGIVVGEHDEDDKGETSVKVQGEESIFKYHPGFLHHANGPLSPNGIRITGKRKEMEPITSTSQKTLCESVISSDSTAPPSPSPPPPPPPDSPTEVHDDPPTPGPQYETQRAIKNNVTIGTRERCICKDNHDVSGYVFIACLFPHSDSSGKPENVRAFSTCNSCSKAFGVRLNPFSLGLPMCPEHAAVVIPHLRS
jgi:hypothetical protein